MRDRPTANRFFGAAADGPEHHPRVNDAARRTRRLLAILVIGTILGQRIAIPLGGSQQIPLVLPFALVLFAIGVRRRLLFVSQSRVSAYAVTMAIMTTSTLVVVATGSAVSLLSVVLLLVIYLSTVFRARHLDSNDVDWLHRLLVRVMTGVAVVTLAQFFLQVLGARWTDSLQRVVPSKFLLTGYNTGNPIFYGSPIYRPNGVLFLEPSFVSLFLGIAIVLGISKRLRLLPIIILFAAMLTTVAGNGFVVVVVGLVVVVVRQRSRAVPILAATAAVVLIALLTPLGDLVLSRTTELSTAGNNTSSSQRLVEPYKILVPDFLHNASTVAIGQGPGRAADIIAANEHGAGVLPATLAKLLVEYGILGAAAFVLFLSVVMAPGSGRYAFAGGLLVNFFIINAGLQQVVLALSTIFLLGLIVPNTAVRPRKTGRPRPRPYGEPSNPEMSA